MHCYPCTIEVAAQAQDTPDKGLPLADPWRPLKFAGTRRVTTRGTGVAALLAGAGGNGMVILIMT